VSKGSLILSTYLKNSWEFDGVYQSCGLDFINILDQLLIVVLMQPVNAHIFKASLIESVKYSLKDHHASEIE